ncbi:Delta-latroinsectotoxin-Lt1a [Talaromyces islandicus]|uniref:Delta-latroinsectotoxin-Lt1a n=1 Tax=Talaromyces islandicus TaxID=28573 RepID=A0A0U1M6J0_TALIS|nr:Delta-latroinsectotoxin-Lt1a [Talaromyces islandicus]
MKAKRIDSSIWEQFRDEIVALYQRQTLKQTMNTMEERHGFKATENQYTTKIKAWGLEKYANSTMWMYVDQKTKKRKLEGKDSVFHIRGRKRSKKSIEREISRNVTYTSQAQLLEDIPTPEGIQVSTPCDKSLPIALRQVYTDNLPWFEFQRDVREMMTQVGVPRLNPGDDMVDQSSSQHKLLHSSHSTTEMLKGAFGLSANSGPPHGYGNMINMDTGSINDLSNLSFRKHTFGKVLPSALYVPLSDLGGLSPSIFGSNEMIHQSNALHIFMEYFVYMVNNGTLDPSYIAKGLEFLSRNCESSLLPVLLGRHSVSVKIFMRKIFPSIVYSGNTGIAKAIIDSGIDMSNYRYPPRGYSIEHNHCMSIAVGNEDHKMVELLCKEKFATEIGSGIAIKLPWDLGNLDILRTLLLFGADPERFVLNRARGFPLIDAAASGNLEAVYMLLEAGANVNSYAPDHYGTALQAATYHKHLKVARLLIEQGADVNVTYRTQRQIPLHAIGMPEYSPFGIAVERNDISLVQLLIANGAYVGGCVANEVAYSHGPGRCPLHNAIENENADLADFLLFSGADINCRNGFRCGDTPLQAAVRRSHLQMVNFLLQRDADVNAAPATSSGLTAIQAAAQSGNIDIVRVLLENNADVNAPAGHSGGLTALQASIINRHPLMAGALYAAGANLNAPPAHSGGFTAIQAAAWIGDLDLLKDLIDWGAEINGPTSEKSGFTVMEAATLSKNMSILGFLVENGVNINASSSESKVSRCLAMAASRDWLDGVEYLLEIGADLGGHYYFDEDSEYFLKYNALGWSIYHENITIMTILLDAGADVYGPVNTFDECALSMGLASAKSRQTTRLLLSKYQDLEKVCRENNIIECAIDIGVQDFEIFKMLHNAIKGLPKDVYDDQIQETWNILPMGTCYVEDISFTQELMELFLKSGVDINSRDNHNTTALHRALESDQTHVFKYLVEKGAEINTPATSGIGTPFQAAIRAENIEIVSFLLERGADINAAPAEIRGITALQAASINGMTGLAIELLRRGASVSEPAARKDGRTAINGAAEHGKHDMLQLLLNHYDGDEDITVVCDVAATYAEKEGHVEIAEWLRKYSVV